MVAMTRSKMMHKNRFFDTFNIPRQGPLYTSESKFDFESFNRDYKTLCRIGPVSLGERVSFMSIITPLMTEHQTLARTDDSIEDKIVLLAIFHVAYSPMGSKIRHANMALYYATQKKLLGVFELDHKYRHITPYMPHVEDLSMVHLSVDDQTVA